LGSIRVLDDSLINRIAAGEVVERPASVVKELIENAIDAGASSISVAIDDGGKRLIRVSDDGSGMDRNDALLALERHATSKLHRADDLDAIATLGFRGEALPSIAAVSRFLMRTAARDGEGTDIEVRGGRIVSVRESGASRGTSIEVASLFFNVPARRKFLKSEATELSHVVRLVTRHALARPALRFALEHAGRKILDVPRAPSLEERAGRVLGHAAADRLVPFHLEREGAVARGLAGRPVDAAPRRDVQYVFVNGRAVQDRTLSHALFEAYGNTVPRERFPAVVLFVEIDPTVVDVNVHPQKLEVRFARPREVHDLVRDAVAEALGGERAVPRFAELRPRVAAGEPREVAEAVARYLARHADPGALRTTPLPGREEGEAATTAPSLERDPHPAAPASEERGLLDEGSAVPLAQLRNSYVIAEDRDGLVIVDQHAAHERILFERFLAEAEANRVETQPLLFPLTIELPPHERVLLEEEIEEFRRLGFHVDPFGGDAVRIEAVPAVVAELDAVTILRELIGEAARARSATAAAAPLRHRLVTTAACKAAIKIRRRLSHDEMRELLEALMRCSSPTTCPHGRPVVFRLSLSDVERAFRRH
jgi:DNA mismatch repair protein MutL